MKDKVSTAKEKFYECDQHQQKIRVAKTMSRFFNIVEFWVNYNASLELALPLVDAGADAQGYLEKVITAHSRNSNRV